MVGRAWRTAAEVMGVGVSGEPWPAARFRNRFEPCARREGMDLLCPPIRGLAAGPKAWWDPRRRISPLAIDHADKRSPCARRRGPHGGAGRLGRIGTDREVDLAESLARSLAAIARHLFLVACGIRAQRYVRHAPGSASLRRALLSCDLGYQQPLEHIGWARAAEQVALHLVAPDRAQEGELLFGLDPLDVDRHGQVMAESDDRLHDRGGARVGGYASDKALAYLELAEGEAAQIT